MSVSSATKSLESSPPSPDLISTVRLVISLSHVGCAACIFKRGTSIMQQPYYVYVLVDPSSLVPFYVGKGKGTRAFHHVRDVRRNRKSYNTLKDSVIHSILASGAQPIVEFIAQGLTEGLAYDLEQTLIDHHGLMSEGGQLTNLTREVARPPLCPNRVPWNKGLRGIVIHDDDYKERLRVEMSIPLAMRLGPDKALAMTEAARNRMKGKTLNE